MKTLITFLTLSIFIFLTSCSTKDTCNKDNPGLGGTASISGQVKHHDKPIPASRVFIKFNTKNFPGYDTTIYNHVVSASGSSDAAYAITGLKSGDYYLYGFGYDSALFQNVSGGIPIEICEDGQVVITNVPVTE